MKPEYYAILIPALLAIIILSVIITRLVIFRSHLPKQTYETLSGEYQLLNNELSATKTKAALLAENYEKAEELATNRLIELQQIDNQLARNMQLVENLLSQLASYESELVEYKEKWQQSFRDAVEKNNTLIRLSSKHEEQQMRINQQEMDLKNMTEKMTGTFELLAGKTLEAKTISFQQTQANEFNHLLAPLKQELTDLKQKMHETNTNASTERNNLFGQVKEIIGQTKVLSAQAENLTNALKGQAKQQGDWGEWILESILQYSGLSKDREYFLQHHQKNDQGQNLRPDVVVKYPDERYLIIDSKVTIVGYDRVVASNDRIEQQLLLTELVGHLRTHIDQLSAKQYQQKKDSLDFVIMFVPIEGAYISAMQHDPEMWQHAYNKRIFLLSPTNLIAALKLVHNMWQLDAVNKNSVDIANRAAAMYDKLKGFVEVFEKIGKNIEQANNAYQDAYKKLKSGKGNLINQAEQMESLQKRQLKDSQKLPEILTDDARFENENGRIL